MAQRWMARSLGAIVMASACGAMPALALACVCVNESVTVASAKGRVFALDVTSAAEAIPDATVELRNKREPHKVSAYPCGAG